MQHNRRVWMQAAGVAAISLALLGTIACNSGNKTTGETIRLSGAGSTFIYPAMTRWTAAYQQAHPTVQINYQSIGSGGGIQQVKAGTVDFGASDLALSDTELKGMTPVLQVAESAGPVCITYNLPGLTAPLKLTSNAVAGMYLGTITTWSDKTITASNPGVTIPNTKVAVVHRAEGSGTTAIFTSYLSAVDATWKSKVGTGKSVSWPTGMAGKGNEGVTGQIRQIPGSIGYVELAYAQQNNLPVAAIQNQAGNFVAPSAAGTTAAIAAFRTELAADVRNLIVNAPASAPDAYPISGMTYLIIPKDGADRTKRAELKKFVQYMLTDGQAAAGQLNYAPLPSVLQQQELGWLSQLTAGGQPLP
jgi:phosphate transport system substrate-binding protein